MDRIELSVQTDADPRDIEALDRGLGAHSRPITETDGFLPLTVLARNGAGELVGGAHGKVNWTWLHVSILWVAEDLRHRGLGSRLLEAIESAALARGCRRSHLDTFSYQARPFYERHGYTVFGVLDEYPPGHQRIFLRKDLRDDKVG
jgi:GNAT superfamily N-acetyltransferase